MTGILNRIPGVKCEVGTCFAEAVCAEFVAVIPGEPALRDERHHIDVALCRPHDDILRRGGLIGALTAYGDRIVRE